LRLAVVLFMFFVSTRQVIAGKMVFVMTSGVWSVKQNHLKLLIYSVITILQYIRISHSYAPFNCHFQVKLGKLVPVILLHLFLA